MNFRKALVAFFALAAVITSSVMVSPAGAEENPDSGQEAPSSEPENQDGYFALKPSSEETPSDTGLPRRLPRWPWSGGCEHEAVSDNIHLTNRNTEVSVHGWWLALNDDCPSKADVWVELQAWSCVNWFGAWSCYWETLDRSRTARVFSGGGTANRVNARHGCVSSSMVSFQVVVDVDIPGEIDSLNRLYKRFNLACYPAS